MQLLYHRFSPVSIKNAERAAQILVSLALPIVIFSSVFTLSAVLASGVMRLFAVILLAESCCLCFPDDMFICCMKNVAKNETVFGEYKKN